MNTAAHKSAILARDMLNRTFQNQRLRNHNKNTPVRVFFPAPLVCSLALLLFLTAGLCAQTVHPLTGRRIAPTMGIGGADWLERTERESEEHPDDALDALNIKPGMVVADVGAGIGYITTRLANRVGSTGKVYATDIQPEMLSRLRERLDQEHITNVEPVLSTQADPKLPAGKIDLILMVDVYHELTQPQRVLRKLKESLKPTGLPCADRIQEGRSNDSDPPRAQDERRRSEDRSGSGRLPAR